jgi:hypothetical protein
MFQQCALPLPVVQASVAAEAAVPGTTLDLSQTNLGQAAWICSETGGVNGVTVQVQVSNDGANWQLGALLAISTAIAANATVIVPLSGGSTPVPSRYVRLSLKDTVGGNHGQLTVRGGFAL